MQWRKAIFSTNGSGTTGHSYAKNESKYRLYTLHRNELKMYHRPKYKTQNLKLLEDNIGEKSRQPWVW